MVCLWCIVRCDLVCCLTCVVVLVRVVCLCVLSVIGGVKVYGVSVCALVFKCVWF